MHKLINEIPTHGGDRVKYYSPGIDVRKNIVFVNGIDNTPTEFAISCQQIMNASGCQVLGVYNEKGNQNLKTIGALLNNPIYKSALVADLLQCTSDQVGLLARRSGYSGTINGCTLSLVNLLINFGSIWPTRPFCILAHSQGNLITSNALFIYEALMATKGVGIKDAKLKANFEKGRVPIHVFAVASPAMTWPDREIAYVLKLYHLLDVVAALSFGENRKGLLNGTSTITNVNAAHSLSSYLCDARLVDAICDQMGTTPRYEIDPVYGFYKDWSYLNSSTRLNNSVPITHANAKASLLSLLRR